MSDTISYNSSFLLLKPEERERLKVIREALEKDENPYSSIKGLPVKPPEKIEVEKKDGKKEVEGRRQKWLSTPHTPRTKVRTRTRLGPDQAALISSPSNPLCPGCGRKIDIVTSVLGTMSLGAFNRDTGEVHEVVNEMDGEILEAPTYQAIPITRKVRVCEGCKGKLKSIIQEEVDRSKESSNVLDEARGCAQGLSHIRYDRYRGRGRR